MRADRLRMYKDDDENAKNEKALRWVEAVRRDNVELMPDSRREFWERARKEEVRERESRNSRPGSIESSAL